MNSKPDEPVGPAVLFTFLAATLSDVAGKLARLESYSGSMIHGAPRSQEMMMALQDLDLLRQMTEDCANISAAAAVNGGTLDQGSPGCLRLEALRGKLLEHANSATPRHPQRERSAGPAGTLDLFVPVTAHAGQDGHGVPPSDA
jgi:hypothetical protein